MWRFMTPSRERAVARRALARRPRRHHPRVTRLEERRLLSVTLVETAPSVSYVGAPVTWTARTSGLGSRPVFQFSVVSPAGDTQVVRDFGFGNSFTWNPMIQGRYEIVAEVKPGLWSPHGQAAYAPYTALSRVMGDTAVVSPMANPLVALYSAPPSPGSSMYVQFAREGPTLSWQQTSPLPIVAGESTNFIVAGMLPDTTYLMRDVLDNGTISAPLAFTTGSLPSYLTFPTFTVTKPPAAGIDPSQAVIFHAGVNKGTAGINIVNTVATDMSGNVLWYYDPVANGYAGYAQNLEPGGTVMIIGGHAIGNAGGYDTLRQVDLAGDTLRETNIHAIDLGLAALHQPPILTLNHEAKLLPNGDTVVLATTPKTVDYKGTPTRFIGAMVIVLNQNFQPVWAWNAFHWLSTNRLGTDHPIPTDWLHANSVTWSPEDDNLVVSLRTQDWAVKIDYANGTGNGHIIWKLGAGGNFTPIANTPDPWFSHQHDMRYINNTTLLVFDDGNTRRATNPTADSRGQEWVLNEQNMTATLVVNADMGNYSPFLGSSELLSNGNLAFTSGGLVTKTGPAGQSIEVLPNGTIIYVQQMSEFEYRSFFNTTLYSSGLLD